MEVIIGAAMIVFAYQRYVAPTQHRNGRGPLPRPAGTRHINHGAGVQNRPATYLDDNNFFFHVYNNTTAAYASK